MQFGKPRNRLLAQRQGASVAFLRSNFIALLALLVSTGIGGYAAIQADQAIEVTEIICPTTTLAAEPGEAGADGADGADGQDGQDGEPGATGPQGEQGEQGEVGPQGEQGEVGPCGPEGPAGPQGPAGPTGATGATGAQGETGPRGEQGEVGPQGAQGPTGPQGIQGEVGPAASEVSYVLQGGTLGESQPTFDGSPLFFGSSIRNGDLVYLNIRVDFDNITSFGAGQYFVTLPYPAKYDATLRSGHLQDFSKERNYPIVGFVNAGSDTMTLWFNNSMDEPFTSSNPTSLAVEDSFHIAGSYISAPE